MANFSKVISSWSFINIFKIVLNIAKLLKTMLNYVDRHIFVILITYRSVVWNFEFQLFQKKKQYLPTTIWILTVFHSYIFKEEPTNLTKFCLRNSRFESLTIEFHFSLHSIGFHEWSLLPICQACPTFSFTQWPYV